LLGVTGFLCGDLFISIIDVKMNLRIHDGSQRPKKINRPSTSHQVQLAGLSSCRPWITETVFLSFSLWDHSTALAGF
jgi:hypothetical protein